MEEKLRLQLRIKHHLWPLPPVLASQVRGTEAKDVLNGYNRHTFFEIIMTRERGQRVSPSKKQNKIKLKKPRNKQKKPLNGLTCNLGRPYDSWIILWEKASWWWRVDCNLLREVLDQQGSPPTSESSSLWPFSHAALLELSTLRRKSLGTVGHVSTHSWHNIP